MKIEHIALYVKELETARNFFVKYLGAKSNEGYHNLKTSFRSYFLSFDDGARLEIMNKPKMPDFPKKFARTGYAASSAVYHFRGDRYPENDKPFGIGSCMIEFSLTDRLSKIDRCGAG